MIRPRPNVEEEIRFEKESAGPGDEALENEAVINGIINSTRRALNTSILKEGTRVNGKIRKKLDRDALYHVAGVKIDSLLEKMLESGELGNLAARINGTALLSEYALKKPPLALINKKTGEIFELLGECVIGRESGIDITLNNKTVSSRHAKLTAKEGFLIAEDLGSTNGSYINENRILQGLRAVAVPGDILKFSNEEFILERK